MNREPLDSKQVQHKPKIIAAIPCFNEERCIGSVVLKTKKFVSSVVVIDDGSGDATADVAAEAGATVYQHDRNRGYGAAVRNALSKGRELGADVLVILDGDGQHDPKDIPRLIKPLLDGEADPADLLLDAQDLHGDGLPDLQHVADGSALRQVNSL